MVIYSSLKNSRQSSSTTSPSFESSLAEVLVLILVLVVHEGFKFLYRVKSCQSLHPLVLIEFLHVGYHPLVLKCRARMRAMAALITTLSLEITSLSGVNRPFTSFKCQWFLLLESSSLHVRWVNNKRPLNIQKILQPHDLKHLDFLGLVYPVVVIDDVDPEPSALVNDMILHEPDIVVVVFWDYVEVIEQVKTLKIQSLWRFALIVV
ncbi:hypothetical protein L1887_04733 [Cichorium endivia]|nr:hypothetical protein L1887_04733 [Cichorium endivia]